MLISLQLLDCKSLKKNSIGYKTISLTSQYMFYLHLLTTGLNIVSYYYSVTHSFRLDMPDLCSTADRVHFLQVSTDSSPCPFSGSRSFVLLPCRGCLSQTVFQSLQSKNIDQNFKQTTEAFCMHYIKFFFVYLPLLTLSPQYKIYGYEKLLCEHNQSLLHFVKLSCIQFHCSNWNFDKQMSTSI